jgi:hypothetical protein
MANQNTKAIVIRDIQSFPIADNTGVPFSDNNIRFIITDNTVLSVTIPTVPTLESNSYTIKFKFVSVGSEYPSVWVLPSDTPTLTVPDGTPTATLSQLNPDVRTVVPGQVLQFISDNDFGVITQVDVSLGLYANPTPNYP